MTKIKKSTDSLWRDINSREEVLNDLKFAANQLNQIEPSELIAIEYSGDRAPHWKPLHIGNYERVVTDGCNFYILLRNYVFIKKSLFEETYEDGSKFKLVNGEEEIKESIARFPLINKMEGLIIGIQRDATTEDVEKFSYISYPSVYPRFDIYRDVNKVLQKYGFSIENYNSLLTTNVKEFPSLQSF